MRLHSEVWTVLLLTGFASVIGRPEDRSNTRPEEKQPDREIRSFSSVPQEENDASVNVSVESLVDSNTTHGERIEDTTLKNTIQTNQTTTLRTELNEKPHERQSRIEQKSFTLYNNTSNNRQHNFLSKFFDKNRNTEMTQLSGTNNDGAASLKTNLAPNDQTLIDIKENYYNNLLSNYYKNNDLDPSDVQSKNDGAFSDNDNVRDVFTFNPIFDYLKSTNHYRDATQVKSGTTGNVVRQIQHYQTVYQPNQLVYVNRNRFHNNLMTNPVYLTNSNNQNSYQIPLNQISVTDQRISPNLDLKHQEYGVKTQNQNYPGVLNQPIFNQNLDSLPGSSNGNKKVGVQKIYDDYFPIVIQNPFNAMWTAFTNVIEYGPEADVCKTKQEARNAVKRHRRRGRNIRKDDFKVVEIQENPDEDEDDEDEPLEPEADETFDEVAPDGGVDVTPDFMNNDALKLFSFNRPSSGSYDIPVPNIRRLKVRKGGVAIAGPGGIATAGSGGTAIVGPGGTAYTKQDGTAIVGPGGSYWMFHTPSRPVMYIPEYNTVLIPASTRGPVKRRPVSEAPKRRRPLIDFIKFMQGKTSSPGSQYGEGASEDELFKTEMKYLSDDKVVEEMNASVTDKEDKDLLENMRELVRTGVIDHVHVVNQPKSFIETSKPQFRYRSTYDAIPYFNQFGGRLNNNYQTKDNFHSTQTNQDSIEPRTHGYHYSYRYVIPRNPNSPSGGAQVFVQQKSILPRPTNNYRFTNEEQIWDRQSIIAPNYRSPRPEIQQRIEFNRLIPRTKSNITGVLVPSTVSNTTNNIISVDHKVKQNITKVENVKHDLQFTNNKKNSEEENKIRIVFDKVKDELPEIKVNSKVKGSISGTNEVTHGADIIDTGSSDHNKRNNTYTNESVYNGVKNNNMIVNLNGSMHNIEKPTIPSVINVDNLKVVIASSSSTPSSIGLVPDLKMNNNNNNSSRSNSNKHIQNNGSRNMNSRLLVKDRPSGEGIREEMILMTGKKPTELILNPIARAVAGPRGVAVAAPIAKAVIHPDEDVMLQFDPEAVAIAGPGGSAHSHPRLIITYMNTTYKNK